MQSSCGWLRMSFLIQGPGKAGTITITIMITITMAMATRTPIRRVEVVEMRVMETGTVKLHPAKYKKVNDTDSESAEDVLFQIGAIHHSNHPLNPRLS